MVMKVSGINNIVFRSTQVSTPDSFVPEQKVKEIKNLGYVTPDFRVSVPVKYKKISEKILDNGLKLYNYKLDNGYKVTIVPMQGSPAVVKSYVNVGSMNETSDIKGISHFLEHMAFNGTNGENGHIKLNQSDSFKKIDKLGGWANASTNYAITDYVNSTPLLDESDLETQIKVIAAMAEDLKLSDSMIAKEKGPVSSEINMILDNPQTIAMDQTVRTLFNIKNPADELVGGSVEHISNLTREDVINYYNKYYTPDNMSIVITGDINPDKAIDLVAKNFTSRKTSQGQKFEERMIPITKTVRKDFKTDKASSAEIVIGFAGPKNNDTRGKILFELATMYINSHEAGLIPKLKKQNVVPIICSEKISTNPNSPRFSFMTLNPSEENCEKVIKQIYNNLSKKVNVNLETVERLKQKVKQENEDILEHSTSVNDCIGYSMLDNDLEYITEYNKILDSITPEELSNAVKEYFDIKKAAITVVHPNEKVNNKTISFKGTQRIPVNKQDVSEHKLSNNYDVGFYRTKSNNINISLKLLNDIPYTKKAGVTEVLNEIYSNGMKNVSVDKFESFKEKHNINLSASAGRGGIGVFFSGDKDNYNLGLTTMKKLLYNPNITEESVKTAIEQVKDKLARTKVSAEFVQSQFDNMINPYAFTRKEIRENIDNVTVEDVKELHNYLLKNSRGIVVANIPEASEKEVKTKMLKSIGKMKPVEENKYRQLEIYKEVKAPAVLQISNFNSQADIAQVYRFKYDNSPKSIAVATVLNSILSTSSIGLFDILREKENLAYSVRSHISTKGDSAKISLNILTTTDNKEIGEYSYDNVQKSIEGFNRQIGELINGKFTDDDLETAKKSIKASLLNNEGNYGKIMTLDNGLDSKYGIDYKNKIYKEIDKVTKKDVMDFGKEIFSHNPVYAIVASQDTLDANKDFLNSLKS